MEQFFKSLLDQDTAPVVICDLTHKIVYMNPAAVSQYHKDLTGACLLDCHNAASCGKINEVIAWFAADPAHNSVHTYYNDKENKDVYMIALRDRDGSLIGYYEKHECRNRDMTPLYTMES